MNKADKSSLIIIIPCSIIILCIMIIMAAYEEWTGLASMLIIIALVSVFVSLANIAANKKTKNN